uniref:Beta-defensin n=1 Tax=Jaculus jaculus TaxID=51337 RepID=A0A8C5KZT1_JACJA
MKLLFPIFASLVLQYQVNSEFLRLRKCLFDFGKCRDSCHKDEREIHTCKNKKCCLGPKVIQLIKSYLRNEIPHIPDEDIIEMLRMERNPTFVTQRNYMFTVLSKTKSASPSPNINSGIVLNASPVKLVTISTSTPSHSVHTSTKSNIKPNRHSANTLPQPPHGPP